MKKTALLFLLTFIFLHQSFAQSPQNPTTLYEWNLSNTFNTPGERVVATINSGTIGSYSGAAIVGQIIDGTTNWGYALPVIANFKLFVNFTGSAYGLQQDVVTPNVTLELKSISATQVAIVANCFSLNKQIRILLRYTTGYTPTLTMGDPTVVNTAGTMLISQPTYSNVLTGRLAINVTDNTKAADYTLAVGGKAIAEAVTVQLQGTWADYVFKPGYHLPSLTDVKTYIDKNHHLPEIPSAQEVANNGINLGEMNKLLVKKVEELTLYLIEKDKEVKAERELSQKQQMTLNAQTLSTQAQDEKIKQLAKQLEALAKKIETKD